MRSSSQLLRRELLTILSAGTITALAGCKGIGGEGTSTETPSDELVITRTTTHTVTTSATTTPTPTPTNETAVIDDGKEYRATSESYQAIIWESGGELILENGAGITLTEQK